MGEAAPALRLVDADGVIVGEQEEHRHGCPHCQDMQDEVDGLNRELRAWRARYAGLARDKDAEALKDPLYVKAEALFDEWKRLCRKPRSDWTTDRFRMVHPFLKRKGFDLCLLAIQGAGFDAFSKVQANGRTKYFNDWKLIWRDEDTFENFCNRASPDDLAAYKAKLELQEAVDGE